MGAPATPAEPPLRALLFSAGQMGLHGRKPEVATCLVPLVDDGGVHHVAVELGN
ncbi:hypothetical protein [Thermomonas sp.]|uniref:hypothetical protein n=1 Tax=Thermomonas sp. TaxID=1971895 RepID=UPI0024870330|nr:hypothetical protein [Thermomonas sp.]MDI1253391.1 hypothetical protein [Thermomonas sp.]